MTRAFAIHYARVMLAEAAKRRNSNVNRHFYWFLFSAAQNARKTLAAPTPTQGDLFA